MRQGLLPCFQDVKTACGLLACGALLGLLCQAQWLADHGWQWPVQRQAKDAAAMGELVPLGLAQAHSWLASGAVAVDARHRAAFSDGHIPGAINLPLNRLQGPGWQRQLLQNLPRQQRLVVYCQQHQCDIGFQVAQRLAAAGWQQVGLLEAGLQGWKKAGYAVLQGGTCGFGQH